MEETNTFPRFLPSLTQEHRSDKHDFKQQREPFLKIQRPMMMLDDKKNWETHAEARPSPPGARQVLARSLTAAASVGICGCTTLTSGSELWAKRKRDDQ